MSEKLLRAFLTVAPPSGNHQWGDQGLKDLTRSTGSDRLYRLAMWGGLEDKSLENAVISNVWYL